MQDKILYGVDQEECIVGVENVPNQNVAHVFSRKNGKLESRYEPYDYLVYVPKNEPLLRKYDVDIVDLEGTNHYNRLVRTKDRGIYLDFKYNAKDSYVPFDKSQYLLQSGKTCFLGMDFNDPLTLFFDLEVYTTEGYEFPNSSRPGDQIILIALKTNKGFEQVLRVDEFDTESELIKHFIALVRKIDPDVIVNHNLFNFDLEYLKDRCALLNIPMALGRNGSEPNTFTTSIKFADRSREYTNFEIYGRQCIDTQYLAEYADVSNRDMPSYRLKDLVKYLGRADDDRTYIEGEDISLVWDNKHPFFDREDLARYAIDDVREAEVLYNEYGQVFFTLTQMVPMNYQEVFRYGTGNQVEYVFLREYLRQEWSYPKNEEEGKVPGGYADVLAWGLFKDSVMYVDVKSLYPSLAYILEIQPKKDELKIFQHILRLLTDLKYSVNKKDDKALYNLVKIFLNTMSYGFIASPWNSFSDYSEASRITLTGQKVMKDMIKMIHGDGGRVIKVDTDGAAIILPDKYKGKEDEYCKLLTKRAPEGIVIENDGMYDGIIPFDGKSYALLEKDGSITIKGNSLIGRSVERFGTHLIEKCIETLFKDSLEVATEKCKSFYAQIKKRIESRDIEPEEVSKRSSINMSLQEYQHKNSAGKTPTLTQYELAINADREYSKGDVIVYYIKEYPYECVTLRGKPVIRKKKCKNYEAAELIENYNYDIEPSFYLDRLDNIARRFMVLGEEMFYGLFNVKVYASDRKRYKKITGYDWRENTST